MKNWIVTYTVDHEAFNIEPIEGKSYTDAFVNAMVKHHGAVITKVEEA